MRLRLGDQSQSDLKSGDSVDHERPSPMREHAAADDGLTLSEERGQFDFGTLKVGDVHAAHHRR